MGSGAAAGGEAEEGVDRGLEGTGVVLDLREQESALECGEQSYGVVVSVDGGREVPGGLEPLQAVADGG
jgi:hypothetical protein